MTQMVSNGMIAQQKIDPDFRGCIINISSVSATMASVNRWGILYLESWIEYGDPIVRR